MNKQRAQNKAYNAHKRACACCMAALVLLALFVLLIIAVKTVDVQAIGPEGSSIGLATINQAVHQRTGVQMGWYELTQQLGKACIVIVSCFALLGLYQLLRRKSLKRVDADLWALAALYVLLAAAYVLFEKAVVNYRPVILPDETHLSPSFPSSHTMLAVCLIASGLMQAERRISSQTLLFVLDVLGVLGMIVMSVGRLASGVHWLTDIAGGVLLGAALSLLYAAALARLDAGKS